MNKFKDMYYYYSNFTCQSLFHNLSAEGNPLTFLTHSLWIAIYTSLESLFEYDFNAVLQFIIRPFMTEPTFTKFYILHLNT